MDLCVMRQQDPGGDRPASVPGLQPAARQSLSELAVPGHIEEIIRSAATADYDGRWAFDTGTPATIIKTQATEKSAGKSLAEKRAAAAALRQVLNVPDPAHTRGRRILVFDDVCTTGYQLNAVADCLLDQGQAARVRALALARAPPATGPPVPVNHPRKVALRSSAGRTAGG